MERKFFRRRKRIIKPRYQLKVAIVTVIFLLIYSLVFGTIIFYPLSEELNSATNIYDQARIAHVALALHKVIWPALIILSFMAFAVVIVLSHRVAGPIYRLEKTIEEFLKGNFKERMRLRKKDEFQEIATFINRLAEFLETSKSSDEKFHSEIKEKLSYISNMLQKDTTPQNDEIPNTINELIKNIDHHQDAFTLHKKD